MVFSLTCLIFLAVGFASASNEDEQISSIADQVRVLTNNQQSLMNIINGQTKTIQSLEQNCQSKKERNSRQVTDSTVAFSAILTKNSIPTSGHHQPVVFDRVYTDTTKGYDNSSGVYTVTRPGLYQLYMSVAVAGSDAVHAYMFKNSESGTLCTCSAINYGTGSCMVIVPLTEADRIWVTDRFGVHVRGNYMTTFNGVCLDCYY